MFTIERISCLHSAKQQLHNNNCTVHFYAYQHLKWLKHDESVKLEKDMYTQNKEEINQ